MMSWNTFGPPPEPEHWYSLAIAPLTRSGIAVICGAQYVGTGDAPRREPFPTTADKVLPATEHEVSKWSTSNRFHRNGPPRCTGGTSLPRSQAGP